MGFFSSHSKKKNQLRFCVENFFFLLCNILFLVVYLFPEWSQRKPISLKHQFIIRKCFFTKKWKKRKHQHNSMLINVRNSYSPQGSSHNTWRKIWVLVKSLLYKVICVAESDWKLDMLADWVRQNQFRLSIWAIHLLTFILSNNSRMGNKSTQESTADGRTAPIYKYFL